MYHNFLNDMFPGWGRVNGTHASDELRRAEVRVIVDVQRKCLNRVSGITINDEVVCVQTLTGNACMVSSCSPVSILLKMPRLPALGLCRRNIKPYSHKIDLMIRRHD